MPSLNKGVAQGSSNTYHFSSWNVSCIGKYFVLELICIPLSVSFRMASTACVMCWSKFYRCEADSSFTLG